MRIRCHVRSLLPLACAFSFLSGCASVGGSLGELLGPEPELAKKDELPKGVPTFVVELKPDGKPAERYKLPLSEDGTYVAQVLKKSRAVRRFGRVNIELWRPLPNGAGHHKLDVQFNRKQREIPPRFDYAIHPDDRLLIIEDTSTILDDVLESVTSPITAAIR